MAAEAISLVLFILTLLAAVQESQSFDFIYNGFKQSGLLLEGTTVIKPSGALRLTDKSPNVRGHAFHPQPIQMLINTSNYSVSPIASSFSTYFVFVIIPSGVDRGGYGLAFTLSPAHSFPGAQNEHYLGILNSTNNGNASNHVFAVEFDTVSGFKDPSDSEGNHVGINNNSMVSIASEIASYYVDGTSESKEMDLEGGKPIQVWVDYDGINKVVNVTISPLSLGKPARPLMSHPIDLSSTLKSTMYAGFSAATGKKASSHYILGWSFRLNGSADPLDPSSLPIAPAENRSRSSKPWVKALIATTVGLVLLLGAFLCLVIYKRKMEFEALEDWELDCPRRFRYKDLYTATKGFSNSELLGIGGFGAVYKGVVPHTGAEIAVKKVISNSASQGAREFAAEIETLGRLRHKHLVGFQGWCKRKNDLLLVYDYIPNGSLDSLLFNPKNHLTVLNWEQRFNIIKGIAAGLLYLHDEWEQVVIHRDVKPGNVLIDGDMNARLSDFGLARLHDHGQNSHTTSVVGTIGYIAPELTWTGKASMSSDVFAYGVVLLEVACGRKPIVHDPQHGAIPLVDWVIETMQNGKIFDAVDPKLNSVYVVEEMGLVLGLGLLCSHPKPECRPTMRRIMRYLNGDDLVPSFEKLGLISSRRIDERTSKYLETIAGHDAITTSFRPSSSTGEISFSSFNSGRY